MTRDDFEALGAKHKAFEVPWTMQKLEEGKPVVARLDGRAFHTFTAGLKRPHDERLRRAFIETTKYLVEQSKATIGYCQSDEITLAWHNSDPLQKLEFGGRVQKFCSLLAAMASVKFNREIQNRIPEKADLLPVLDARVYQYPTQALAAEAFVWREADATRNSLTMAAGAYYGHNLLERVGYARKHEMLNEAGVEWCDYPSSFQRGVYIRRERVMKSLTPEELSKIPGNSRPSGPVIRSVVTELDLPPVATLKNLVDCLMFGAEPDSDWLGYLPWSQAKENRETA